MSLRVVRTASTRLVTRQVEKSLLDALGRGVATTLLVSSFAESLAAQEFLASREGLSLGVEVTTLFAWARDAWELWGDGRRLADKTTRLLMMGETLDEFERGGGLTIGNTPGAVRTLARIAKEALPWIPCRGDGTVDAEECTSRGLSPAEVEALCVVAEYGRIATTHDVVEEAEALVALPAMLAQEGMRLPSLLLSGFSELTRAQRELLCGLAALTDVTLFVTSGEGASFEQYEDLVAAVVATAEQYGLVVDGDFGAGGAPGEGDSPVLAASDELNLLCAALFEPELAGTVKSTGAVSMLFPSGPVAEPEAIARQVVALVDEGARSVAVVAPNPLGMWRNLSPKLAARGLTSLVRADEQFTSLESGRAILEFLEGVSELVELDKTWPEPTETPKGTVVNLGDMSWWPPTKLSDVLFSYVFGVPAKNANCIDAKWRNNRLLTPGAVLKDLLNPSKETVSKQLADATRELLKGNLGNAMTKILVPFSAGMRDDVDELAREEAQKTIGAVLSLAEACRELGMSANPNADSPLELKDLVRRCKVVLRETRVTLRPILEVDDARCEVLILSPSQAAAMPRRFDAVVMCNLTNEEMPLGQHEKVTDAILEALGVEGRRDALVPARAEFRAVISKAYKRLVLERVLNDRASKDTYPSVMLIELLACYGMDDKKVEELKIPHEGFDETRLGENGSCTGKPLSIYASELVGSPDEITDEARKYVLVPQNGREELPGGKPMLSASQLESYLECPLKWFAQRRLGLEDVGADFSPMEMGNFVHGVLEATRGDILQEALLREGLITPDEASSSFSWPSALDPSIRVAGTSITPESLESASDILERNYEELRQYQLVAGGLVPHSGWERYKLEKIHKDLLTTLEYESERLLGFEPRMLEYKFGKDELVEYAGAYVNGTIDRVDFDGHGNVIVIDYKHKGTNDFASEHDALGNLIDGSIDKPPRRIQSLLYAQVIRRMLPGKKVVGALYLSTRDDHALAGAVQDNLVENVFGSMPGKKRLPGVSVSQGEDFGASSGETGMNALLDRTEELIAEKVRQLMHGHIEACPIDKTACSFCPVVGCERRLS